MSIIKPCTGSSILFYSFNSLKFKKIYTFIVYNLEQINHVSKFYFCIPPNDKNNISSPSDIVIHLICEHVVTDA